MTHSKNSKGFGGADVRRKPQISAGEGFHTGDARKAIVASQSTGFGEFGGGVFGLAFEAVGRDEEHVNERQFRNGAARLFEPQDRLVGARL